MKVYQELAILVAAYQRCLSAENTLWIERHYERIQDIMAAAPAGAGIDCGTVLWPTTSKPNRLVFGLSFHHMDENGMDDVWTDHTLIVTPSLAWGYEMRFTGRNRNEIKEYLSQVYSAWLASESRTSGSEAWLAEETSVQEVREVAIG